jgi:hypothetical protein
MSLLKVIYNSIYHVLYLPSLLCLHQWLPDDGFQQYRLPRTPLPVSDYLAPNPWIQLALSSQSYFTTGGLPPISSSWRHALWNSRHSNLIFQLNAWGYIPNVASSMTRELVCHVQLLLALVSAIFSSLSLSNLCSPHDLVETLFPAVFSYGVTWLLLRKRVYWPFPSKDGLFWFLYSGILAAMSQ